MKKRTIYIILVLVCTYVLAGKVSAATPRVMVSNYSIGGESVEAGKEFTLKVTLKNTAARAVRNIKVTANTENGELLPSKGAGTAYISEIAADSEERLSFPLKAINGLEEKSYKLSLKTEYESLGGMEYTVEDSIFIPISLEQRVSVTDIMIPEEEIQLGDSIEITASVNNMGEGTLYNVMAYVEGYNISSQASYIGNIESGKTGTVDVITKATALYQPGKKNTITVSYENAKGEGKKEEFPILLYDATGGINVLEPRYADLEQVKTSASQGVVLKNIAILAVIIIIVVVIVLLSIRRRKRKQAILDEF